MAVVWIPALLRDLTDGQARVTVPVTPISDCGLRIAESKIRNLKSEIRNQREVGCDPTSRWWWTAG
jgi:hypothetical protein